MTDKTVREPLSEQPEEIWGYSILFQLAEALGYEIDHDTASVSDRLPDGSWKVTGYIVADPQAVLDEALEVIREVRS